MRAYGIRKHDDNCCPGHAKYGQRGLTMKGKKRPRKFHKDKPRKAKMRQIKIILWEDLELE
jgi:hypothetical protein